MTPSPRSLTKAVAYFRSVARRVAPRARRLASPSASVWGRVRAPRTPRRRRAAFGVRSSPGLFPLLPRTPSERRNLRSEGTWPWKQWYPPGWVPWVLGALARDPHVPELEGDGEASARRERTDSVR